MSQATSIRRCAAAAVMLLAPFAMSSAYAQGVQVLEDIAYKSGKIEGYEAERSKLDLYLPADVKNFPVIDWFHGGNITSGDKAGGGQDATYREFAGRNHGSIVMRIPDPEDPVAAAIVEFVTRLAH